MRFALIGLEGVAENMVRRLRQQDIEVVGCDENGELSKQLADEAGLIATSSVVAALRKLPGDSPKIVWLMLANNAAVDKEIKNLVNRLAFGDIVVDGSHSNYRDSQRRGALLSQSGIGFVDAGIMDDGNGLEKGFCITLGGERDKVEIVEPLMQALAADGGNGWSHVGAMGAGHFARMVHSGIEWSVRQAFSEGFELLKGKAGFSFDLEQVAQTWSKGAMLDGAVLSDEVAILRAEASGGAQLPNFDELRWSAIEAIDQNISVPAISAALQCAAGSRKN